jgi:heme oxygenase
MIASRCGANTLVREKSEPELAKAKPKSKLNAILKPLHRSLNPLHRSLKVLVEVLQEIFDESAYQRFLDRSQQQSSPKAYAIFLKENEQARWRRPRCC